MFMPEHWTGTRNNTEGVVVATGGGDPLELDLSVFEPAGLEDDIPLEDRSRGQNDRSRSRLDQAGQDGGAGNDSHVSVPIPLTLDGGSQASDDFEDRFDLSRYLQDVVHDGGAAQLRTELAEMQTMLSERDMFI